ncbi:MAG: hypothetical protein LBI06_01060 [Treponema sp.]|nr:hypothetical protein [Treponema sp.]
MGVVKTDYSQFIIICSHTPAAVGTQRGSVRTCRIHLRSLRSAPAGNSKGIRYPAAPQQRRAYVGKDV